MGLLKAVGEGLECAAERWAVNEAFRRGQNAEAPLHIAGSDRDPEKQRMQETLDRRYAEGQRSVLVKIGNKLVGD
jgi:hypothetical protein